MRWREIIGLAVLVVLGATLLTYQVGGAAFIQRFALYDNNLVTPVGVTTHALNIYVKGSDIASTTETDASTLAAGTASLASTIARAFGFDTSGNVWRRELVDASGNKQVTGVDAHGASITMKPMLAGARATHQVSLENAVSVGTMGSPLQDLDGVFLTRPHTAMADGISNTASSTAATDFTVLGAQGAATAVHLVAITVANTSATAIYVEVKNGGVVKWVFPAAANSGGATFAFPVPLKGLANTAWACKASSAVSATFCSMQGFKSKL